MFNYIINTAKPTHHYHKLNENTYVYEPICTCFTESMNTSGTVNCPVHGLMRQLPNGGVEPFYKEKRTRI